MTILIEAWLAAYLDGVVARRGNAIDVQREAVCYANGSEPERSCCHANVDRWLEENSTCSAARGWIISAIMGERMILEAHSVVRNADGSMMDITLRASNQRAPFIAHLGSEEEFVAARMVVNQVVWPSS